MPVYTVETPDGRKVKIEAASPDAAMSGAQEWASQNPRQAASASKPRVDPSMTAIGAGSLGIQNMIPFGDELMSGLMAPIGATIDYAQGRGFDLGRALDENLAFTRGRSAQAREEYPTATLAGEIAGGVFAGGSAAKAGATILPKLANKSLAVRALGAGAEGAGWGGLYGFAGGEGGLDNRLAEAGEGALLGAAIGGAIPVAGAALQKASRPIARIAANIANPTAARQSAGVERVLQTAQQAGLSADDLARGVQEGQVIGQQDTLLSDLTRSVKRQPGEARKVISDALDQGYAANNAAALDDVQRGLGGEPNFYKWLDGFKASRTQNAGKAYDAVFRNNWGTRGNPVELDRLLPRIPAEAVRTAEKIARAQGRPFGAQMVASIDDAAGTVSFSRAPSLEEAEIIRRGLKSAASKAFRAGDGALGSEYRSLEKQLRGVLDDASPNLSQVRRAYADSMAIDEAAQEGLTLLNKPADYVEFMVDGMSRAEIEAMRRGMASSLKDAVEKGQINRDAVKRLFGSERQRRILQQLWPDDQSFQSFRKSMENRASFSDMRQNVLGNSRTQQDLADQNGLASGLFRSAVKAATGNPRGALMDAAAEFAARSMDKARGMNPEALKAAAQLLVESDPARVQQLLTLAKRQDSAAVRALDSALRRVIGSPAFQQRLLVGGVSAASQ